MKTIIRTTTKHLMVFIAIIFVLLTLLVVTALIPRENTHQKMLESAEYMNEKQSTFLIRDFLHASVIDHYADCITLSIAYYLDEENPLESVMWASYYGAPSSRMNQFLLESMKSDAIPNHEYLRYWHGSAGVMRFMHLFWNIRQIYIFHYVLLAGLLLTLLVLLIRNGLVPEAVAFSLSMIVVSIWFVPLCLEYTWMFLVMLVASIIAVQMAFRCHYGSISIFFMIVGMVAAYLDFLTTETLTLLIPLIFILRIYRRQGGKGSWSIAVKGCMLWSIGYIGMWVLKWGIASVVLKENVMPYVMGHIGERLEGNVGRPIGNFALAAIMRNLKCLFPYEYGISGAILVFAFIVSAVIVPVAMNKIRLRKTINWNMVLMLFLLGMVPFLRFAVMRNHSFIHFFFTHRALASTALALCFIILELIEPVRKAVNPHGSDNPHAVSE